jgi:hypothetical protein
VHITVYEDSESGAGTIQKVGFKFYKDLGNAAYTDFLRNAADKAKKDGVIDMGDWTSIRRYRPANMGVLIKTILGYAWLAANSKDERLRPCIDIANWLENSMEERFMEEDLEEDMEQQDQDMPEASYNQDDSMGKMARDLTSIIESLKSITTMGENTNKDITSIKEEAAHVTEKLSSRMMDMANHLGDMDSKGDEMCRMQEATEARLDKGLDEINRKLKLADAETKRAFEQLYDKVAGHHEEWSDENMSIKDLIQGIKRKGEAMDYDADTGTEDAAPPKRNPETELAVSDDELEEKEYTGAMNHGGDMSTINKENMLSWLAYHGQQAKNAMRPFNMDLMLPKNTRLSYAEDRLSRFIFDAVVANPQAKKNGGVQLVREGNQALGWYPHGTLRDHISQPEVWGEVTDEVFWKIITETENRKTFTSSFMIKNIRDTFFLIKARPRVKDENHQGYYDRAHKSSAGGSAPATDDENSEWKDWRKHREHKPQDTAAGNKDGPTMRPQAAKEEIAKTQIDSAATKRPTGIAMATVPGMAPKTWFIGQTTPDTYTQSGLVETWRSVKPGDKSPWDERIAKCTMEEHRRGK